MSIVTKLDDRRLQKILKELRPEAGRIVRRTGMQVLRNAKTSMSGPKSGRVYARSGKPHQASAPGEAPAVDTGNLVNSLQIEMEGDLTAVVFTDVEYAPTLEFGGAKMAMRPFLGPAAQKERKNFERSLSDLMDSS